jgi:hypothetical protein
MVSPDDEIPLAAAPESTGGGNTLFTVTETLLDAVLPAASLATAVSLCAPFAFAVVLHE